jgi:hypothetical protein
MKLPPFHPGGFLVGLVIGYVVIVPLVNIGVAVAFRVWWP